MKTDSNGLIEMEHCAFPGNVGDSCAETCRYISLVAFVFNSFEQQAFSKAIEMFLSPVGVLRHPKSPWREDDTSSDQVLPLVVAADFCGFDLPGFVFKTKTGNGDYVSPMLFAVQKRFKRKQYWFFDLSILAQCYVFKIPFRWNDEKKSFEGSKGSSCDYLNLIISLIHSVKTKTETWPIKKAIKSLDKDVVFQKVKDYYSNEPNAFVVSWYEKAITKLWSKL